MAKKHKRNNTKKSVVVNKSAVNETLQTQEAMVTQAGRILSEHPSQNITPSKLKSLLEEAENGDIRAQHDLFLDIEERDAGIAANIQTRKRAILTLDWLISPPLNASEKDEALREEIEQYFYQLTGLEDMLVDCMDAVGHGFSALEIEWQYKQNKWLPARFIHRPQSWFRWDKDDNLRLKTPDNQDGEPLRPLSWVVHYHKSRSTQAARGGLYRTLAWLYMFKHYSVHDFAEFLELYGMPIRIGKYGAGATPDEKRTLLRALAEIGHNAAGIMPESMQVELHNIASSMSNASNPFLQMVDWCEKAIARLILGQTLTSGADGKSSTNALGRVHNEVRRDLLVSDAKQLSQTITQQIILPYLQVNVDPNIDPAHIPYFEFDTKEREDLSQFAESLPKLVNIGVQIPENWAREKLGIPDASDGEALLKPLQMGFKSEGEHEQTALSAQHGCQCAACRGVAAGETLPKANGTQGELDRAVDTALGDIDFNAQFNPMVKSAVGLLARCGSYEEAFAALSERYPQLDTREHERYLTQALFVSELLGAVNERR
ncbi:DUF935 domain-containing protein [Pasteurellaceae bacterium HPA106]|uniref:DUF935 domain-containing protein n=1 Tax=Spirabiliibacterium pneumoniae TaxID=221400 RepID=UPI001AAE0B58|nr:DUF935 family protein [Spirabiliibacterium pneumoniae]MBE2895465.1 DUF935 domain-containing protein [Spirabiliibacterium pneumoniae]